MFYLYQYLTIMGVLHILALILVQMAFHTDHAFFKTRPYTVSRVPGHGLQPQQYGPMI